MRLFLTFCVGLCLVAGCKGATELSLEGNWIDTTSDGQQYVQGFSILPDGNAASIGMATLRYEKWEVLDNNRKLVLHGKSIGNGMTIDFSDTLKIVAATPDALELERTGEDGSSYRTAYRRTQLQFQGTYSGTLPAADCPGIKVSLQLNDDGTFSMTSGYLERDSKFESEGRYLLDGEYLITTENNSDSTFFRIEGDSLRMLDYQRQPITGELAEMYVLKHTPQL